MFLNRSYNPPNFNDLREGLNNYAAKNSYQQNLIELQANRMHRNKELFSLMESEMFRIADELQKAKTQKKKEKLSKEFDHIATQYAFQNGIDSDVTFNLI